MNINKDALEVLGKLGIQVAAAPNIQKNANEVMNTGASGLGAELVPTSVLAKDIIDAVRDYPSFINSLPGYHGTGLGKIEEKSILGDVGFFNLHAEKTTSALALAQGTNQAVTDKVTLTQKQMDMTIDVSNELSVFNVAGAAGFEQKLKEKIAKAMVRTVEALIINGDTETGATGNVNKDDGAPAATSYYLAADGLRKKVIADLTDAGVNAGTVGFDDLVGIADKIGDYFADPESCLWLFNRSTYNKFMTVAEFADHSKNGKSATVNTGAITNILGSDVFSARDLGKTEADAKLSGTASNNTKGQCLLFWKPAVQYGYGQELQLKLQDLGPDGYQLQGWFNVAVSVLYQHGGTVDPTVGIGYNITV